MLSLTEVNDICTREKIFQRNQRGAIRRTTIVSLILVPFLETPFALSAVGESAHAVSGVADKTETVAVTRYSLGEVIQCAFSVNEDTFFIYPAITHWPI